MIEASRAWADRAEAHFATAKREVAVTHEANPAAVIYSSHLCVQAYLRARLLQAEVPFPHTPHLVVLLYLCMDAEPSWEGFRDHLRTLTSHYMDTRDATKPVPPERVEECLSCCTAFRGEARKALGL